MTVETLSRSMTAAEETMWAAEYRSNPFGEYRADIRSAQIAQILFNSNVKKDKARKLEDFLLFRPREKKKKDDSVGKKLLNVFSKLKGDK